MKFELPPQSGGQRFYAHANHLYSVAALTNSAGAVVERYRYDTYGQRTVLAPDGITTRAVSSYNQQVGFTGRYLDKETSLWYFRARYYSGTLGRFIGRDPLGYVDGMGLYGAYYVPNGLDPNGTLTIIGDTIGLARWWPDYSRAPSDSPDVERIKKQGILNANELYFSSRIDAAALPGTNMEALYNSTLFLWRAMIYSTNPEPSNTYDDEFKELIASQEFRGLMYQKPKICCDKGSVFTHALEKSGGETGYTPMATPTGKHYSKGLAMGPFYSTSSSTSSSGANCITFKMTLGFRIGDAGALTSKLLLRFPVPWAGAIIEHTLCCDASQSVMLTVSNVPSFKAYKNGTAFAVRDSRIEDLADMATAVNGPNQAKSTVMYNGPVP